MEEERTGRRVNREEEQRIRAEIRSKVSRHAHKIRSCVGIRWITSGISPRMQVSWLGTTADIAEEIRDAIEFSLKIIAIIINYTQYSITII